MAQDPVAWQAEVFAAQPHAQDACQVRRWDDAAKDPDAQVPSCADFEPLLRGLAR